MNRLIVEGELVAYRHIGMIGHRQYIIVKRRADRAVRIVLEQALIDLGFFRYADTSDIEWWSHLDARKATDEEYRQQVERLGQL